MEIRSSDFKSRVDNSSSRDVYERNAKFDINSALTVASSKMN